MDKSDLLALIEQEETNTVSLSTGELAEQRREALQYFQGKPYGTEKEGRSGVVTTEVRDAILGLLPIIMDIFTASDEIVRCDPQGPEDEEQAQQATDWLNYKFSRGTDGWKALYCAVFDALLSKTGYIKVYWEDYSVGGVETYEGLSPEEFAMLQQDGELEVEDISQEEDGTIEVTFRRSGKKGRICLEAIPPEELRVARDTGNDLEKTRFVEHVKLMTISDVRQMGFEVDDDIAGDRGGNDLDQERLERYTPEGGDPNTDENPSDPAMRKVWFREAYIRTDYDEDGITELRRVCIVGTEILENEECDSIPIVSGQALMLPHKHYGMSIHDVIGDIQLIKSTVTRQLLDNAYQANNSRVAVLDGMVNLGDLQTTRPGGIVRQKVMGAIQPIQPQLLGPSFYNLLDYFDKMKTNRVGTNDFPHQADADAINAKAAYHEAYQRGAMLRPAMMARTIAETLVRPLFLKMLELGSKHQVKKEMMRLRNRWVPVDPRGWKDRFDMTVTVGLGTGSQQQIMQGAMGVIQLQMQMAQMTQGRVVNESNLYHSAHRFAKAVFPKDAEMFFTNPAGLPPPQQQPPIELLELQQRAKEKEAQQQFKYAQLQANQMAEQLGRQFQAQMVQFQAQMDARNKQIEAMIDAQSQERETRAKMVEEQIRADSKQREAMIEAIKEAKVVMAQSEANKSEIMLQGVLDRMLEQQKAQEEQRKELLKAMLAPREIVRDSKGKAKGTRVVDE